MDKQPVSPSPSAIHNDVKLVDRVRSIWHFAFSKLKAHSQFEQRVGELCERLKQAIDEGRSLFRAIDSLHSDSLAEPADSNSPQKAKAASQAR